MARASRDPAQRQAARSAKRIARDIVPLTIGSRCFNYKTGRPIVSEFVRGVLRVETGEWTLSSHATVLKGHPNCESVFLMREDRATVRTALARFLRSRRGRSRLLELQLATASTEGWKMRNARLYGISQKVVT